MRLAPGHRRLLTAVFSGQLARIAFKLESMPEFIRLAEKGGETNRHGRCNRPPAMNDFVDRAWRDADGVGHGVLRNPHRFEVFLQKNFTGCNGRIHRAFAWMSIWFFIFSEPLRTQQLLTMKDCSVNTAQLPHLRLLYDALAENQSYFVHRVHPRFFRFPLRERITCWNSVNGSQRWQPAPGRNPSTGRRSATGR